MSKFRLKILVIIGFTFTIIFAGLKGVDAFIGAGKIKGLVFETEAIAQLSTDEFHMNASINAQGFRGSPIEIDQPKGTRIAFLGDAYVFGWGVNDSSTWVSALARELNVESAVECVNLGKPGATVASYREIAEQALSVLKPDYLVIGISEGINLSQLTNWNWQGFNSETAVNVGESPAESGWFPNITGVLRSGDQILDVAKVWNDELEAIQFQLNQIEGNPLNYLNEVVKDAVQAGNVNPMVLAEVALTPHRFVAMEQLSDPLIVDALVRMKTELSAIYETCKQLHIYPIVVNIPTPYYASDEDRSNVHALGFYTTEHEVEEVLESTHRVHELVEGIGFEWINLTPQLQQAALHDRLYFPLDGHLTASGHAVISQLIAAELQSLLD